MESPGTVGELTETLRQGGYLADRGLATALFVALSLNRPILLEGEVGVGKTEVAKVIAFAEKSRISTAVTSEIMPRPYCAAAPDSCRSWVTPTLVPRPARTSVAVTTMLAWPRPFSSAPLACTTTRLAASSRSVMSAVPANC